MYCLTQIMRNTSQISMRAVLPNLSNTSFQCQLCENDEIHYLYEYLYYITSDEISKKCITRDEISKKCITSDEISKKCITSDEISKKARYEETVHYINLTTG